jgi:2-dehydro-3-deoxyphosphooctonate aldolase (KDO 8-P synthase)
LNEIASVVNILQIPAFLCRQTNFILSVCSQNLPVNIKKGQFLAPWDVNNVLEKAKSTGNKKIMICERGTSFGYNNLVSDMRSLATMRKNHVPIIYDATHSVQLPGNKGRVSDGNAELIPTLARSAVAAGISGIFLETHPKPKYALSDGPNSLPIGKIEGLLKKLKKIDEVIKLSNIRPIL